MTLGVVLKDQKFFILELRSRCGLAEAHGLTPIEAFG